MGWDWDLWDRLEVERARTADADATPEELVRIAFAPHALVPKNRTGMHAAEAARTAILHPAFPKDRLDDAIARCSSPTSPARSAWWR